MHAWRQKEGLDKKILDFSASINPLGPPSQAWLAYRQSFSGVSLYPEPYAEGLIQRLAAYHGLDSDFFLVGNGATQLIHLTARAFSFSRVLLLAPLFSEHKAAWVLGGSPTEVFCLRPPSFSLSLQDLSLRLGPRIGALILSNPNSPTGALISREEMRELVCFCEHRGIYLIVDEAFMDWVEEASCKFWVPSTRRLVILRSLTKMFSLPGLRLGYLMASPGTVDHLKRYLEPWSVNGPAQRVAAACLQDQAFVLKSRQAMEKEREWLRDRLASLGWLFPFPSKANFLLVRIRPRRITAEDLFSALAKEGVLIRPCTDFTGLGQRFFRLAVRTRRDHLRLLDALEAFAQRRL